MNMPEIASTTSSLPEWKFEPVLLSDHMIRDRRRLMSSIGMEERTRTAYVLVLQKGKPQARVEVS
jgi:hypothetical protein